jgi:hypothetical protein
VSVGRTRAAGCVTMAVARSQHTRPPALVQGDTAERRAAAAPRWVPGGGSNPTGHSGWCSGPPKSGLLKSGLVKLGREPEEPLPGLVKLGRL